MGSGVGFEERCENGVAFLKGDIAFRTFLADIYREGDDIGWGVCGGNDTGLQPVEKF
jgi:hypothetical protein